MPTTNYRLIIKDRGWNEIKKEHKRLDGVKIEVGLFGSGNSPENNIAARGAVHEYGARIKITEKMRAFLHAIGIHVKASTMFINIPSRPFMRNAFDSNIRVLKKFIEVQYKKLLNDEIELDKFFKRIGVFHEGQIKGSIKTGSYTRLHPATIAKKGSSKPLIDTGVMLNGVKYKIKIRL